MNTHYIILSLLASAAMLNAMELKKALEPKLHVLAIPGQNGMGSQPEYVESLLGAHNVNVTPVPTPSVLADLGQGFCMSHLRKTVAATNAHTSIVHATSQGTATALNYVGLEDQGKHVKALILESVLASGNSAIYRTVTGPAMQLPVDKIPFSYYWLPYPASLACPSYVPGGKQAIKSIEHIPTNLPVIIAHSEGDIQLPVSGARALYYRLRERGNENVYLILKQGIQHIYVLGNQNGNDAAVVQAILTKHNLLLADDKTKKEMDLAPYQPDHKLFKKDYENLMGKEKNHQRIAYTLAVGALYALYCSITTYWNMQ